MFTLVVDDFGIQYTNQDDLDHLIEALKAKYIISIDQTGAKYCGMTLEWDYERRTCDISMPGYIERTLSRFQHPTPIRAEHAPHPWTKLEYGARIQYAETDDDAQILPKKDLTRIPGNPRSITILCKSNRLHASHRNRIISFRTSQRHRKHYEKNHASIKLLRDTSRSKNAIQQKRRDTTCRKRCIILERNAGEIASRWILLPKQQHNTFTQRHSKSRTHGRTWLLPMH